jgi:DNA-binding IclR family transcriptional regulator
MAAPVFQGEEIVATIALVGTSASVETDPGGVIALALRETAENLSMELGFVGPERRHA